MINRLECKKKQLNLSAAEILLFPCAANCFISKYYASQDLPFGLSRWCG